MSELGFLAFWVPSAFAFVAGASYVGTKFALRSYFEGEDPPSSFISIDDERRHQ